MIEFGGWLMPVQYSGIMDEHRAVRTSLGVFDISHMGEFFVAGESAERWLNGMLTNNVARLAPGECQYTLLLNETGGIIDDLIVYRLESSRYLLVVNASKIDEDRSWLEQHLDAGVGLRDESAEYAALAVQGRNAPQLFAALFGNEPACPARNHVATVSFDGAQCLVARTGYTGEDGFELFCPSGTGPKLWRAVLETGARWQIKPCGLGARDTLRRSFRRNHSARSRAGVFRRSAKAGVHRAGEAHFAERKGRHTETGSFQNARGIAATALALQSGEERNGRE